MEVLKGPAANFYGFNAFDGVINIITKTPEEAKGITAQVGGGEFGTIRSTAMYANRHDRLGYRLAYSHDENDQWRNRDSLAYRANRFNGMVEYRLWNQANFRVEGGINDTNRLDTAAESVRIDTLNTQSYARIGYEQEDFFVQAFWPRQDATVEFNPVSPLGGIIAFGDADGRSSNIPFNNNTYDVVAQGQRAFGTTHTLIAGRNPLSSTQIASFSREDRLGLYLQDEWHPLKQAWLTAGMRMDLHSEINPTYSPRIALFYSPIPNHTIRISGTVGYRSPTLLETNAEAVTTVTVFGLTTINTLEGSSNLKPEKNFLI